MQRGLAAEVSQSSALLNIAHDVLYRNCHSCLKDWILVNKKTLNGMRQKFVIGERIQDHRVNYIYI